MAYDGSVMHISDIMIDVEEVDGSDGDGLQWDRLLEHVRE